MDPRESERTWQVGDLSKLRGVTVRALHHYDNIGILPPQERSESGYRLYGPEDLQRLSEIVMLRRLGLSLTDVAAILNNRNGQLPDLLERHLADLEHRISQQLVLRKQISAVRERLTSGNWYETNDAALTAIKEMMNMDSGLRQRIARWFTRTSRKRNVTWSRCSVSVEAASIEISRDERSTPRSMLGTA